MMEVYAILFSGLLKATFWRIGWGLKDEASTLQAANMMHEASECYAVLVGWSVLLFILGTCFLELVLR